MSLFNVDVCSVLSIDACGPSDFTLDILYDTSILAAESIVNNDGDGNETRSIVWNVERMLCVLDELGDVLASCHRCEQGVSRRWLTVRMTEVRLHNPQSAFDWGDVPTMPDVVVDRMCAVARAAAMSYSWHISVHLNEAQQRKVADVVRRSGAICWYLGTLHADTADVIQTYSCANRDATTLLLTEPPGDGYDVEAGDFEVMPNELLCMIAGRMPVYAAIELSTVCRRWRDCVFADCTVRELTDGDGDRERFLFRNWAVTVDQTQRFLDAVRRISTDMKNVTRQGPMYTHWHLNRCLAEVQRTVGRLRLLPENTDGADSAALFGIGSTFGVSDPGTAILNIALEYAANWQLDDVLRRQCCAAVDCLHEALQSTYTTRDAWLFAHRLEFGIRDDDGGGGAAAVRTTAQRRSAALPPPQLVDPTAKNAARAKRRDDKHRQRRRNAR
jgi:hypothetical protein